MSHTSSGYKRSSVNASDPCLHLQNDIKRIAISRIAADLLKSLLAFKQSKFEETGYQVDIPFGMFGLKLEDFYQRRKENIFFIDLLELVNLRVLEESKLRILLEQLQDFVSKLFSKYHSRDMKSFLPEIRNAEKLLTISDTISKDFEKNSKELQKLREKSKVKSNAMAYMNNQVYEVQHNCVESECVLHPIEFRYELSFHYQTLEQFKLKLLQGKNKLQKTIDNVENASVKEDTIFNCVRREQEIYIEMLHAKFAEMVKQYDSHTEDLDRQISYKTNSLTAMMDQRADCLAKMDFFNAEIQNLLEWERTWEMKKLEEATTNLGKDQKPRKKKKKARK